MSGKTLVQLACTIKKYENWYNPHEDVSWGTDAIERWSDTETAAALLLERLKSRYDAGERQATDQEVEETRAVVARLTGRILP